MTTIENVLFLKRENAVYDHVLSVKEESNNGSKLSELSFMGCMDRK